MPVGTWLSHAPREDARLSIICFPSSGASPSMFAHWQNALPPDVDVLTLHLPGRGPRADEPLVSSLVELADAAAQEIAGALSKRQFVFFGHSLGAFLAYAVAARLAELGAREPEMLIVSSAGAPTVPRTQYHLLDDDEFLDALASLGGIPDSLRGEPGLLRAAMPVLRADVRASETYEPRATRLSCPISVFAGQDDPVVDQEALLAWREMTAGRCVTHTLPGNHFYLNEQFRELLLLMQQDIGAATRTQPQVGKPVLRAGARSGVAEPVAVVGMGCRLPGAPSVEALWDLLADGRDAVGEIPPRRWDVDRLGPEGPGRTYARWGGLIDGIEQFDAGFFGLSPREAQRMDPQLRLMMMVAYEAVEDAHIPAEALAGKRGAVFIGLSTAEYWEMQTQQTSLDLHSLTGSGLRSFLAGRLSYLLDLRGPSMTLDSACSSSLAAVHLACQALRTGESEIAFAGGVNLVLKPDHAVAYAQAHVMSPRGRSCFGDVDANGYVRSDGVGIVVLKRLSDALADGDPIHAVLRGSAINNDGQSGSSLLSPSVAGQTAVISDALAAAGLAARDVSYVEAHGTGTPTGDRTELAALDQVYGDARRTCLVGSVKSNIGHTEPAAGIAGLLKAILAVKQRRIPASLHLREPNTIVDWATSGLRIPTQLEHWPHTGPAVAAVSSFGLSGSNAHLILSEPPARSARQAQEQGWRPQVLPVSARSAAAARTLAGTYADLLTGRPDELCAAAARGRSHHPVRIAAYGDNAPALKTALRDCVPADCGDRPARQLIWVLSGQGSQWPGMAEELRAASAVFRKAHNDAIDACDKLIDAEHGVSLRSMLLDPDHPGHDRVELIQPAIWSVQVALAAMWQSWGVHPDGVIGHSMGEAAAAYIAGVLPLADAARVIVHRSRLVAQLAPPGAMLVTALSPQDAEQEAARWGLDVAAYHGPRSTVLSGDPDAVQKAASDLATRGIQAQQVDVSFASHSRHMDSLQGPLRDMLAELAPQRCRTAMYSTVRGQIIDGTELDAGYWADNLRAPVLLTQAVQEFAGEAAFLEVSPHPLLTAPIRSASDGVTAVGSLHRRTAAAEALGNTVCRLYTAGVDIDWNTYYPGARPVPPLPHYPWQLERHWFAQTADGLLPDAAGTPAPVSTPEITMKWATDGGVTVHVHPNGHHAAGERPAEHMSTQDQVVPPAAAAVPSPKVDPATLVVAEVAAILGLPTDKVPRHQRFSLLGLDSIMLLELRDRLARRIGVQLELAHLSATTIDSLLAGIANEKTVRHPLSAENVKL